MIFWVHFCRSWNYARECRYNKNWDISVAKVVVPGKIDDNDLASQQIDKRLFALFLFLSCRRWHSNRSTTQGDLSFSKDRDFRRDFVFRGLPGLMIKDSLKCGWEGPYSFPSKFFSLEFKTEVVHNVVVVRSTTPPHAQGSIFLQADPFFN